MLSSGFMPEHTKAQARLQLVIGGNNQPRPDSNTSDDIQPISMKDSNVILHPAGTPSHPNMNQMDI